MGTGEDNSGARREPRGPARFKGWDARGKQRPGSRKLAMRDSPNRPNGIEPAGSRSRSISVLLFPSLTSDLSLSHPFRTVLFPLYLSLSFPLGFSIHPTDLPLRFGHPPFPSKWRRGRRSPLDSVPLSPAPSFSPCGSHGPVSLARSAHGSGSCLVPSTRVARSLCPLPSPRVISHSLAFVLALACVCIFLCVHEVDRAGLA